MEENQLPSTPHAPGAGQPVDPTIQRKHAAMMERLSNRHQSRLAGKHDPNSIGAPSFESTQSFLSQFSESKLSIESHLSRIRKDPDPTHKDNLETISLSISDLEKLIAENSYFLPPYELRTCLNTIDNLKQSLDDVTSLVIPKKKFSFKNKPSKKPAQQDAVCEAEKKQNVSLEKLGFKDLSVAPGFRGEENKALVEEFTGSELGGGNGEFTLSDLRDCEVRLKGRLRALFMDKLTNCKVYVGAVMGSVLIEGVEGCVFVLASHQIRIHNAKDCDFYLRVRSRPIIEDSTGVRFAPYCLSYEGIEEDLKEANLGEETGNWENVDDFRWLRAVQSPNWSILPENERIGTVDISNM
ncbi:Beta-tubulin folding cofactor C [Handroanthus impetiginosus]|uniref:Beta-tubulin folding cofactor C n=1 Tax=Handroanthus impetiginosus TaxID=429701 RepID=A0A2G9IAJ5_9LAMI|nr:Beta-tubulin folding cofactor C [Handroanthus impetiginosus]